MLRKLTLMFLSYRFIKMPNIGTKMECKFNF